MFITTISEFFHKHRRIAAVIIGIAIVIPFVFGASIGVFEDLFSKNDTKSYDDIGEMYGSDISRSDFMDQRSRVIINNPYRYAYVQGQFRVVPYDIKDYDKMTIETLRKIQEIKELGMYDVADAEISNAVSSMFKSESGEFDRPRYLEFLANRNCTVKEYEDAQADKIRLARLDSYIESALSISDEEIRQAYYGEGKEYQIYTYSVKSADYSKDINITDEESKEYYDIHKADFKVPDSKALVVATFNRANYKKDVKIDADKLKAFAAKNPVRYKLDMRKSNHIIIKKTPETTEVKEGETPIDVVAKNAEAKKKAEALLLKLNAEIAADALSNKKLATEKAAWDVKVNALNKQKKEKVITQDQYSKKLAELNKVIPAREMSVVDRFSKFARENSEGPSKTTGGSIAWMSEDDNGYEEAYRTALFELKEGEYSAIVESNAGYHIILCNIVGPTYEDAKARISADYVNDQSKKLAKRAAAMFQKNLISEMEYGQVGVSAVDRFKSVAEDMKITVVETNPIKPTDRLARSVDNKPIDIRFVGKAITKISKEQPLSNLLEGNTSFSIAVYKSMETGYIPEYDKLPTARITEIKALLKDKKSLAKAKSAIEASSVTIAKKLSTVVNIADIAKEFKLKKIEPFKISDSIKGVLNIAEVKSEVVSLPKFEVSDVIEATNATGYEVFILTKVILPKTAEFEENKERLKNTITRGKRGVLREAFYKKLEAKSETKLSEIWKERLGEEK